jgi:hypothetical protein
MVSKVFRSPDHLITAISRSFTSYPSPGIPPYPKSTQIGVDFRIPAPFLIRVHPRSAVGLVFRSRRLRRCQRSPSPSLGIPPHPKSTQIGVDFRIPALFLIRVHPRRSAVSFGFPISAMSAIGSLSTRIPKHLAHIIPEASQESGQHPKNQPKPLQLNELR